MSNTHSHVHEVRVSVVVWSVLLVSCTSVLFWPVYRWCSRWCTAVSCTGWQLSLLTPDASSSSCLWGFWRLWWLRVWGCSSEPPPPRCRSASLNSPVSADAQVCPPVVFMQVCLFPAGGDVCRSSHSDPCSVVLGVLCQFRHHPLVPAVDVLHLLRQVGALSDLISAAVNREKKKKHSLHF